MLPSILFTVWLVPTGFSHIALYVSSSFFVSVILYSAAVSGSVLVIVQGPLPVTGIDSQYSNEFLSTSIKPSVIPPEDTSTSLVVPSDIETLPTPAVSTISPKILSMASSNSALSRALK